MPIVRFPALMKFYIDNQSEFLVAGDTVTELLYNVLIRYPTLKPHLFDTNGKLRRHFNIFVNGEHIRELDGLDTLLKEDDKVILMISAAGGGNMVFAKSLDKTPMCHPERSEASLRRLRDSHCTGVQRKCRLRKARALRATKTDFAIATGAAILHIDKSGKISKIAGIYLP